MSFVVCLMSCLAHPALQHRVRRLNGGGVPQLSFYRRKHSALVMKFTHTGMCVCVCACKGRGKYYTQMPLKLTLVQAHILHEHNTCPAGAEFARAWHAHRGLVLPCMWAWSYLVCGPGPSLCVGLVLPCMWAWSSFVCGPGPTLYVGLVLPCMWAWSSLVYGPGPSLCVGLVLPCMWAWSSLVCGPGPSLCVGLVLPCVWAWSYLICGPGPTLCVMPLAQVQPCLSFTASAGT